MSTSRPQSLRPQAPRPMAFAPAPPEALPKSHVTRALHFFMLLIVLHQLFGSLILERPMPGEDPAWPYWLHEYLGMAGLGAVTLFWVWTLLRDRRETRLGQLFPWFSARGWGGLFADLRSLLGDLASLRKPSLHLGAIASAVHGLGLLAASYMALSGTFWFLVFKGGPYARTVLGTHKLVANLMWAYVIAHVSIAVLHRLLGDDIFSRMFWTRRANS